MTTTEPPFAQAELDEQTQQDIALVAQHVGASLLTGYVAGDEWENYPEIGELDWIRIRDHLAESHPYPDPAEYLAAYDRLAARAEHDA